MSDKDDFKPLIDACRKLGQSASAGSILVGKRAHAAIKKHLSGVRDSGARRRRRSETITAMAAAIAAASLRVPGSINAMIAVFHTSEIFGPAEARMMPLRTLRLFAPTIRRNAKDETWVVKPKIQDQTHVLFGRVVAGDFSTDQVQAEVDAILGRTPHIKKPKQPPQLTASNVFQLFTSLDIDGQREFVQRLRQKIENREPEPERHDVSIPIGPPPGKVPEARPSLLEKISGRRAG